MFPEAVRVVLVRGKNSESDQSLTQLCLLLAA